LNRVISNHSTPQVNHSDIECWRGKWMSRQTPLKAVCQLCTDQRYQARLADPHHTGGFDFQFLKFTYLYRQPLPRKRQPRISILPQKWPEEFLFAMLMWVYTSLKFHEGYTQWGVEPEKNMDSKDINSDSPSIHNSLPRFLEKYILEQARGGRRDLCWRNNADSTGVTQAQKFIEAYAAFLKRQGKLPIPGINLRPTSYQLNTQK
jgi:hypothetical protein